MESSLIAKKKNENLTDDNSIIYISIADCQLNSEQVIAKEIFNARTKKFLKKN